MRFSLGEFNALPAEQAHEALLACCAAQRWAGEVAAGRPYASVAELLTRSAAAVAGLDAADLRQALAGHPRIGARHQAAAEGSWSGQEQAGVGTASQEVRHALADGNRAYEQRFGHIYLVCATGRSGAELLALLQERLGHDPATEWQVVASELEKINRIRLQKLIDGQSGHDTCGGGDR
jgi:2-oxo-4-hydroxy-4-carboxy-5-ureidoimidazoline decarboxylase